jgi:hypothetical protein
MRLWAFLAVASLTCFASGCAAKETHRRDPGIIVVSLLGEESGEAAADLLLVDSSLDSLSRLGVSTTRIVTHEFLTDPARSSVLVTLEEATDPCSALDWRGLASDAGPDDLVIVFGGLIRSTAPFTRFVGYACPEPLDTTCTVGAVASGVILFDRAGPQDGLSAERVLMHEIGHIAGLIHVGADEFDDCDPELADADNLMQTERHGGSGPEVQLTLTERQLDLLRRYLGPRRDQ